MKIINFFVIILLAAQGYSQQAVPSSGGTVSGASGSFSFTVGQVDYGYYSNGNVSMSEGVQQTAAPDFVFCYGSKIADLTARIGKLNMKWYSSADTKSALGATTLLASKPYYYTETINNAVSSRKLVTVIVNPFSIAGSITGASGAVCYNSGKTLTLSATHRGNVQWQTAPLLPTGTFGTFTDIPGKTSDTLNTGILTATNYFRAVVINGVCLSKNTAPVKVTVTPQSVAGAVSGGGGSVCYGTNSTKLTLSGYKGKIKWQSSTDSGFTSPILLTGTTAAYIVKNLTTTTYYRAVVTSGAATCTPAYTIPVVINVNAPVNAGTVSGTDDVICSGASTSLSLSDYDEGASIQWQKASTLTATYANATTGTGFATANYTTPILTATAYYRAKVTYNGCYSTSQPYLVTVQKAIAGTISGGTISPETASINSTSVLTLTGSVGTDIQWYSSNSTSSESFTPIVGATSNTYEKNNTTIGTTYFKVSVAFPGCAPKIGPIIHVAIGATISSAKVTSTDNSFNAIAYPNPFGESFMIDLNTSSLEFVQIKVYDMLGKLIEQRKVRPTEIPELHIGVQFPMGIYNIILNQGEEFKTLRVIKR